MRENVGPSIGIAAVAAFGYAIWAWILVVLLWVAVTIYALVKLIGAPNDHPSATTLLVTLVGVMTFWPVAISLGIYLIGRSMRSSKRELPDGDAGA